MGNLIKEWIKGVLTEEIKDIVVVYAGRFQPFHKGHYATYSHLVQKFGENNVWIGTSNKSGGPKDPFNFLEKKKIMTTMFGIPANKVVQVKNPYNPTEILNEFSPKTTAFVTVVGEKDAARLGGKYFKKFHSGAGFKPAIGYDENGYVYTSPAQPNAISGTDVRKWLSVGDESKRKAGFKKAYPKFNPQIYNLITKKLIAVESLMEHFFKTFDIKALTESTLSGGYGADSGEPDAMYVVPNKRRVLGLGPQAQKRDYWFVSGGYIQLDFPKADVMVKRSAKGTGDFYQYSSTRKVFTMDDLLDIPETEDFTTADTATTPLDAAPPDAPLDNTVDITGVKDEELQEAYAKLGHEIVEWSTNNKIQRINERQFRLLEKIGRKFSKFLLGDYKDYEKSGMVQCAECGDWFKQIQYRHLKYSHNISMKEYIEKYPNHPLISESFKNFGNKNPMNSQIVKEKHKKIMQSDEYKKNHSNLMMGKNKGKIRLDVSEKNKNMVFRKKISEGVKKSYINNTTLKELRSDTGKKFGFGNKETQKKIANILNWTPIENRNKYLLYAENVRRLTNNEYLKYFSLIPNAKKRGREYHLDHKYSILEGFKNNIPIEVISHYKNLEIKHHSLNESKGGGSSIKLRTLIKDITHSEHILDNRILLLCGGAYGHMNHPFDMELDLTFGDLKNIITKALKGDLELTREKTDGQALAISWRDDRGLIAARNKGHLANMGEKAMSIADVASKFGGRGGLTDAYNFAMRDLEVAIKGLSKAQRDKIFAQGKKFMNLEVIYPTSVNVIPYGQALLVFHNTTEYDESGVAVGAEQSDAKILAGMIKQINQDVQEKYKIQGPPITQLPKNVNLEKLQPKYLGMLKNLQSKFGLKDSDGMAEYHQAWWGDYVDKNTPEKLDKSTREGLIKRWAFFDKSFTLNKNNIKSEKVLNWAQGVDKNDHQKISKDNIRPFEDIFLGVGAEVLSLMSSVLTANPDEAVRNMKQRLDQTIKDVKVGGDEKKIKKLQLELERMAALGGVDKIVPNEGIVFVYKGMTLKLTGSFAPLNQILGLFY